MKTKADGAKVNYRVIPLENWMEKTVLVEIKNSGNLECLDENENLVVGIKTYLFVLWGNPPATVQSPHSQNGPMAKDAWLVRKVY